MQGPPEGLRYIIGYLHVVVDNGGVSELHVLILSTQNFKTQKNYTRFVLKTWNVYLHIKIIAHTVTKQIRF